MRPALRIGVACAALIALGRTAFTQELKPMDPKADPAYEVATVRPSDPADQSSGFQLRGRRVIVLNETVETILVFAFGVQKRQILNAPEWVSQAHYDISGVADIEGQPNTQQMRSMLRNLLKDRFRLSLHEDQRDVPVYLLNVAKAGAKLDKSDAKDALPDQTGQHGAVATFRFTNNSISDFASFLQFELDRPVLDQTGLPGRYNFVLKWTPELSDKPASDSAPGIFSAVQQELGLKLDPAKRPATVLIIDQLERPSGN